MDDREQRDRPSRRPCFPDGWGFDRLELAAGRAVDDIPSTRFQLRANRVGGFEITGSPALDALGEKSLSLFFIRAS